MRTIAYTLAVCMSLTVVARAQSAGGRVSREGAREDVRLARHALEEAHAGLTRYTSKEKLDDVFDRAERSIAGPMTAFDLYRVLAPAVAAIKCGHTGVSLPDEAWQPYARSEPLLPVLMRVVGGRAFILRDLSERGGALAGMEVRSIDGVPFERVFQVVSTATPGDGDVPTSRARAVGNWWFNARLPFLLGLRAPYTLGLRDPATKRAEEVRVEGRTFEALDAEWKARFPQDRPPRERCEFELLDGGSVARMRIGGFGVFTDDSGKVKTADFIAGAFARMHENNTKSLVLDLRGNGGGEDELGKLLLSYLVDAPFAYYQDLVANALTFDFTKYMDTPGGIPSEYFERRADGKYHCVGHPNWGTQKPSDPRFAGKLVILVDGGSFSTTSEFLSHVHDRGLAVFVGEESAGGYYGNTSGFNLTLTLPNSKLKVRIPTMAYYMAVKRSKHAARGVMPDMPISPTIADLLAGRDPALDAALRLARGR